MNEQKYKALIHHIIHECSDRPERLGAIRLNKVLWFSDVIAFQVDGEPITGETYVKRKLGPVPRHILATLRKLEQEGSIAIKEREFAYDTQIFYSKHSPDSASLSDNEKRIARHVLDSLLGYSANVVSEISHDIIWDAVHEGEEIPVYATLVAVPEEITPDMIEWAEAVTRDQAAA